MMQAVIMAAGKSTRTYPITLTMPKALLPVLDSTIIEHNLDQLKGIVDEAIIIVGHMKEQIISHLGDSYNGLSLRYVEQKQQLGTGHALMQAKPFLKDRFLVMNGDDLYHKSDIKAVASHRFCLLAKEDPHPERYGVLFVDGRKVKRIFEKPSKPQSNFVNIGLYAFDVSVFDYKLKKTRRGEYEITDYVTLAAREKPFFFEMLKGYWIPVGYPWQLIEVNAFFLKKMRRSVIKGTIEKSVVIKGPIHLGEGSVIRSGTYIEGPVYIGKGCIIGPQAYLRPDTVIYDKCKIRAEVIDSVIMENTTAKHYSYIGHSVIGRNCNIAAGTITADYRHDSKNNMTLINGKKVDSGRRKLGAFISDDVSTGISTSIYPGRKIWPGCSTLPNSTVKKDIKRKG